MSNDQNPANQATEETKTTSVVAFANQKGGVGKTTLSTQFAYFLTTKLEKKVLFIDMDAQASASETLLEGEKYTGTTSQDLFSPNLGEVKVQTTPRGIDLLGSTQSPDGYDVEALPLERVLLPKKWLEPILGNYDFVVIDCPPSLGRRLAGSLIVADNVVCPVKLSGYSVSGLKSLFTTIIQLKKRSNKKLRILGIAVNEFQDTAAQRDAKILVDRALPNYLFTTNIRSRSPIDVASRGKPIQEVRNGQRASEELESLFREILTRLASCRGMPHA